MNTLQTTNNAALQVPSDITPEALEKALTGDIKSLTSQERLQFMAATCASLGLNPLTKPFDYVELNGKLVMYANKGCAEQLRKVHGVTIEVIERIREKGVYAVRVKATDASGRSDEAIGAVPVADNAAGEFLANAMMKAETKAKRRVTFSVCGMAMPTVDDLQMSTMKTVSGDDSAAIDRLNALATKSSPVVTPPHTATSPVITLPVEFPESTKSQGGDSSDDPDWIVTVVNADPLSVASEPVAEARNIDAATELKLEGIIGTLPDPKKGVEFLVTKGKLEKGQGLRMVEAAYAAKIIANPSGWAKTVIDSTK